MPNGGTDCCGTCFFNSKNDGLTGFGPTSDKKGKSICVIRKIEIPNPYWTYCPNHNGHNRDKIEVPVGPVTTYGQDNSGKATMKVWLDPPDSEIIRETLLTELDKTSISRTAFFPSPTHFEHQVIRHLAFLKEKRALPRLYELTQTSFGDHRYPPTFMTEWVSDLIGYAVEALLEISEGNNYLEKVQHLIDIGITEKYIPENDPYQSIRYYLIRGLEYCAQPLADIMLRKGLKDPQKSIRNTASEILEKRTYLNSQ